MLRDVEFIKQEDDPATIAVIGAISLKNLWPERIGKGQYVCNHHNFHYMVAEKEHLEVYGRMPATKSIEPIDCEDCEPFKEGGLWFHANGCRALMLNLELCPYGVCDSIKQFNAKYLHLLEDSAESYCVAFVEVRKDEQPSEGGWRWHKWGPYIGDGDPQFEYLYDEENFESVFATMSTRLRARQASTGMVDGCVRAGRSLLPRTIGKP